MHNFTVQIDDSLYKRLLQRVEEDQKTIEQIIVDYLDENMPDLDDPSNFGYSLAQMAEAFDLRSGRSDISENFDDYLNGLPLDEKR